MIQTGRVPVTGITTIAFDADEPLEHERCLRLKSISQMLELVEGSAIGTGIHRV